MSGTKRFGVEGEVEGYSFVLVDDELRMRLRITIDVKHQNRENR